MFKKSIFAFTVLMLLSFTGDQLYKDGSYTGISRSFYLDEPYFGCSKIVVNNGRITNVEFFVRDSSKHENVDDKYEKYFAGNDLYIRQCRNDWTGIQSYPDSLIKYQDLSKVDVISGATWSYNIFKAASLEALKTAE
jgi:major membrane immunogen (membrane-anchored lipoprotein)